MEALVWDYRYEIAIYHDPSDCPVRQVYEDAGGSSDNERSLRGSSDIDDDYYDDDEMQQNSWFELEMPEEEAHDFDEDGEGLCNWREFSAKFLDWPEIAELKDDETRCTICFEDYNDTTVWPFRLPCNGGHAICLGCAREWFSGFENFHGSNGSNGCPTCRQKLFAVERDFAPQFTSIVEEPWSEAGEQTQESIPHIDDDDWLEEVWFPMKTLRL